MSERPSMRLALETTLFKINFATFTIFYSQGKTTTNILYKLLCQQAILRNEPYLV